MKVKLNIEIELPDEFSDYSHAEMQQLLFDEYVNTVACSHLRDAVEWCGEARVGTADEDSNKKIIYEHHQAWGKICTQATFDFEMESL
tara:strand:+ start:302 stop:565 length:264 start_codon:yes stop_codon:yes gene_type:complete